MCHNALVFVLKMSSEKGGHDAGGGASQNGSVSRVPIQVSKYLLLQIHILGNTFLCEIHSQLVTA